MSFKPTDEQIAIVDATKASEDNLLVSALAGAAKTSTLVLVAEAQKRIPVLCLAFNKRIATEMQERLPGNCTAMTLNSLGHQAWGRAVGKRLRVDTSKNYTILKSLVDDLKGADKEAAYESFTDILKAIEQGKTYGYIPTGAAEEAHALMDDSEFFAFLDEEPTPLMEQLIRKATVISIQQGFQGHIDFSDQILLPTVFPCSFQQYPLVLIDEAQDLSELNHTMLRKIARERLIGVGDECQSIYAFRGAHEESMGLLRKQFNMRSLILSISFRCPQSVVREAQWRAPHMRFPEWAKEGEVKSLETWGIDNLPDAATIICRNNAPIFSMAIKLLRNGRYAQIIGNDIGKGLIKTLKKLGPAAMPKEQVHAAIDQWLKAKLSKTRRPGSIYDQAECLRVFADQGDDLGGAVLYAEHIMNAKGPIQMMTGHKSKGLEFEDVYILDRQLVQMEKHEQEKNLMYVMQTRSKERLTYVTSEGFVE